MQQGRRFRRSHEDWLHRAGLYANACKEEEEWNEKSDTFAIVFPQINAQLFLGPRTYLSFVAAANEFAWFAEIVAVVVGAVAVGFAVQSVGLLLAVDWAVVG